jgi:hypothetical protein
LYRFTEEIYSKWQLISNLPARRRRSLALKIKLNPAPNRLLITSQERLKKCCGHFGARIFGFRRGFGEGAGLINPVTEPKRSQKPKRPLPRKAFPNGYNIFENALKANL